MLKQPVLWSAAALALAALPLMVRDARSGPVPPADTNAERAVSVRILFGVARIRPKTWDGSMRLDRGSVLRLTGVYFEQNDTILSGNAWKCTSRATVYMDSKSPRGYDPVHTKPWELIPNGIVATLDAPPDAQVSVHTASGDFSFRLDQLALGRPLRIARWRRLGGAAAAQRRAHHSARRKRLCVAAGGFARGFVGFVDQLCQGRGFGLGGAARRLRLAAAGAGERNGPEGQFPHGAGGRRPEPPVGHLVGQGERGMGIVRPLSRERALVGRSSPFQEAKAPTFSMPPRGTRAEDSTSCGRVSAGGVPKSCGRRSTARHGPPNGASARV